MDITLKENLLCNKCGARITILKILLKIRFFKLRADMVIIGKCPQKHKKKFRTSIPTTSVEDSILKSHIFKCVKCDQPITFEISVQKDSDVKFIIRCPKHGRSSCTVPIDIYNRFTVGGDLINQAEVVRNRLTQADKAGIVGLVFAGFSLVLVFLMIFLYPNIVSPGDITGTFALYIFTAFIVASCVLGPVWVLLEHVVKHTTLSYISLAINGSLALIYVILVLSMAPLILGVN